MLNRAERFKILGTIHKCCKFGLLPAEVNFSTWEMIPYKGGRKMWQSRLWIFFFGLHVMYKLGSLASAYFLEDTALHELIIHAVMAVAPAVYMYWYYVLYVEHPSVFGAYVRMTLKGNIGALDDQEPKRRTRRLKEYTPQDAFVISLPCLLLSAEAAIVLALIWYPGMKLMLFNIIPTEHQTWIVFTILLIEETRYIIIFCFITVPIWSLQVVTFDLVNSRLQLLIDSMKGPTRAGSLEYVYKSLRRIQLYMGIVNLISPCIIFSWKVLCIAMSIGTGYAAIAHFNDYPLFGVMYYVCVLDCSFIYLFSYANAFKIPALNGKVKRRALLEVRHDKSQASKIFKRQIRSIPQLGIKVGEFHMMERESTLIFIHYVLNNIVAMLVANRPT